jgi:predicted phage baseplate assembly protein
VYAPVPVEQGRLFVEHLGTSDGTPNQRFTLARTGLILRPPGAAQSGQDVTVLTTLGTTTEIWTLQETLAFSQSAQRDFAVQVDADDRATIVFGDGTFGAMPSAGATVTATYRTSGGAAGNVPAGAIATILDAPQLALLGATVTNPAPASGGADRESIEHAVQHAPAVFRSLRRAVTAADYEQIALSFKGVSKVRAAAIGWNEITLYVAPEGMGNVSDVLEANLKGYFEDKRMISQIIEVKDVSYVPIMVTAQVKVESFYVRGDVVAQLQRAAAELLDFDRVGFGETVYLSKFYERCQEVPGVVFVNITEFRRADQPDPMGDTSGTIVLGPNEIPVVPSERDYADGLKVTEPDAP